MTKVTNSLVDKEAVDHELVERAYKDIEKIFSRHVEEATMEVGNYLVENFYGGNIELARDKNKCLKKESLNRLIKRLNNRSSNSPSRSWIYQAIGLVVQAEDIKNLGEDVFQMYGKLLVSHKACLLSIKKRDIEKKKTLILEAVNKKLTVKEINERKNELISKNNWSSGILSLVEDPEIVLKKDKELMFSSITLKDVPVDKLQKAKEKSNKKCNEMKDAVTKFEIEIEKHQNYIKGYESLIGDLETAIKENTVDTKEKKSEKKKK